MLSELDHKYKYSSAYTDTNLSDEMIEPIRILTKLRTSNESKTEMDSIGASQNQSDILLRLLQNQSALENDFRTKLFRIFQGAAESAFLPTYKLKNQFSELDLYPRFKRKIERDVRRSLLEDSLEEGMSHHGEAILEKAITSNAALAMQAIEEFITNENDPGFAADVLWLIANVRIPAEIGWRRKLITDALNSTFNDLREAAIRAVEHWEGNNILVEILKSHVEQVEWLREYCDEVVDDLSE